MIRKQYKKYNDGFLCVESNGEYSFYSILQFEFDYITAKQANYIINRLHENVEAGYKALDFLRAIKDSKENG